MANEKTPWGEDRDDYYRDIESQAAEAYDAMERIRVTLREFSEGECSDYGALEVIEKAVNRYLARCDSFPRRPVFGRSV